MPKQSRVVLDSQAVIAFLYEEEGFGFVWDLFRAAAKTGVKHLISTVNWAEIRNVVERRIQKPNTWNKIRERLQHLPIEIVQVDQELAEEAGRLKSMGGLSLADCFAAALAIRENAAICTGDREFKRLEKEVTILWI